MRDGSESTAAKNVYKKGYHITGKPKTESGNRDIPLSKNALSLLQNRKQNEYFNSIGSKIKINGYTNFIFLNNKKDNAIIPRQFGDALTAACKKYNKRELKFAEKEHREPELLPMITPHIYWDNRINILHQILHQLKGKLFQVMQSYTKLIGDSAQIPNIEIGTYAQKPHKISMIDT